MLVIVIIIIIICMTNKWTKFKRVEITFSIIIIITIVIILNKIWYNMHIRCCGCSFVCVYICTCDFKQKYIIFYFIHSIVPIATTIKHELKILILLIIVNKMNIHKLANLNCITIIIIFVSCPFLGFFI